MTDADLNIKRASPFFRVNYRAEFTNGGRGCQGNQRWMLIMLAGRQAVFWPDQASGEEEARLSGNK
jgi:hypothetical protein